MNRRKWFSYLREELSLEQSRTGHTSSQQHAKPVVAVACTARDRREEVGTAYLCAKSIAVLVLMVIVVALVVRRVEDGRGRKVLEQRRERDACGRALVRYVQLHRQCSEAVAYQRLATF